ncbi:MAG: hypothetical protein ACFFCW_40100 [Candidatus Hodarchaeota archaeon]
MKKGRRWIVLIFMGLALIKFDSSTLAGDTQAERATLRGIKEVLVVIEILDPHFKRSGLTENQIRTDMSSKFTVAGINILTEEEYFDKALTEITPLAPIVSVALSAKKSNNLYFIHIYFQVLQRVFLEREPSMNVPAVTWWVDRMGILAPQKITYARNAVKDCTDEFINAYLSVNPKQRWKE